MKGDRVIECKGRNRPHFVGKKCHGGCGHVFSNNGPMVIVEVNNGWFRGDDDVYAFCPECHAKEKEKK